MIIQIRQGITLSAKADRYQTLLREKVLPAYESALGNLGIYLGREAGSGLVNFLVLSLWSSREELIEFDGPLGSGVDPSVEERELLLAFESVARNYEVVQISQPAKGR
jgi:hypothetical protein